MGVVYKAEDTKLERTVALKFLSTRLLGDVEDRARFKIEAQATAALNHPNIAQVYAIEEFEPAPAEPGDGEMFIVMEYIDGLELREIIAANGGMPSETVCDYASQIAAGLQAAHEKGIVHRDIKSADIMVTGKDQLKIMDFGLAKVRGSALLTRVGTTVGMAAYMSPEQARSKEVDQRSDIWSFGVVLYELLTGKLPFPGDYEQAVMYSILNEEPEQPEEAPANLQQVLRKAFAKDRNERYQNVAEVLSELRSQTGPETLSGVKSTKTPARANSHSPMQGKRWFFYGGVAALLLLAAIAYFVSRSRPIESIAVMPFVNDSGNDEVEHLSDGMTETLISNLSQLPQLKVKARSSVFRYEGKEVGVRTLGKEFNVQAILNGRVVQRGEQLTLSLESVNTQTENVIWSEQYNRKQADLVALQSEIARDVSGKLKTKLSGGDVAKVTKTYTTNPEAYQLYLKGRFYWNKRTGESLKKAAEFYRQAIEKDPNFALAYSGLAETYVLFPAYSVALAKDIMPQAKAAAVRALEIDDSLAEAHSAPSNSTRIMRPPINGLGLNSQL